MPLELYVFFFFNDTATTEIYTLSLHDALPISIEIAARKGDFFVTKLLLERGADVRLKTSAGSTLLHEAADRKSTRLNSSHANISYAVFCLKKKNLYSYSTSLSFSRPTSI